MQGPNSVDRAKQYVDRGLTSDFGYQVGPSLGKGAIAQRYSASPRTQHFEIGAAFYLEKYVKRVVPSPYQINVNFKAAISDSSVHENLRCGH
ncbi:hypothetical protein HHL14_00495 [Paraburkholderia sp. G-4-1-8]|uniref:Uncharacterized protein n=1 Tax=Paraburkholderia antibiotica TaxID=2728839 RepID=A0A7X9X0X9_9BURK|nr:hypothetical protein [Paraburkholderia antibiotica]